MAREELQPITWQIKETPAWHSWRWYLIAGLVLLGFIIFSLFTSNFLLTLLIIIGLIALYLSRQAKTPHQIKINNKGIKIDRDFYEFKELKSFWLFYEKNSWQELSLHSKKTFQPFIKIPLADQNPLPIRQFLLQFLPEKKQEPSMLEIILERIGV